MKKFIFIGLMLFFSTPLWADISLEPLLNTVILQLQAEQWVTTQTALVSVNINAAVSDQNIINMQNNIMQKLKTLSEGDWHIVSFNRQQDQSGLESIQITAEARLPQANLGALRDKAKAMSKPGETYIIENVQFVPSEDEIRQANIQLRNSIYSQAKSEIDVLNKSYTDQKYYLHQINFISGLQPMPMAHSNVMYMKAAAGGVAPAARLQVGNKATLQATVILASMPDQVAQHLTRQ